MDTFAEEIDAGSRFAFGANWKRFAEGVGEDAIEGSIDMIRTMLNVEDLKGRRFVDVGSGSGLSSLAARRLGATVHSFDYDPDSVECTRQMRARFHPDDEGWRVERGSALDAEYMGTLGRFDVVYSWGVLHHTGDMWRGIDNCISLLADDGMLYIALYNDQGRTSRGWHLVKRLYCSGAMGRAAVSSVFVPYFVGLGLASDTWHRRNPVRRYLKPINRGMSYVRDWDDWLGGLPFEVAKPEEVIRHCHRRGLALLDMTTVGGAMGCNQFVFRRDG